MVKLEKKHLVFLAKFSIIFIFLEFVLLGTITQPLEIFIATTQAGLLGLKSQANYIFVDSGAFVIVPECTGIVGTSILAAIIFSLKKPEFKKKLLIFMAGAIPLLILNFIRVLLVTWIGKEFGVDTAEIIHVASWFMSTFLVLGFWYYLTKRITGEKNFSGFL